MSRTIMSPGVEIFEKDLSLRTELPVGTQIFVPGFAAQGPTSEPILITTLSELEQIYGIPQTPAEKYFHYSAREVLNSPGVLNCLRLPYGAGSGTDFSDAYTGLFFPMGFDSAADTWWIGKPISKTFSLTDYNKLVNGDFAWGNTGTSGNEVGDEIEANLMQANVQEVGGTLTLSSGFFIFNDLQSTVNEVGEGYYLALADNYAPDRDTTTTPYDAVQKFDTLEDIDDFLTWTPAQNDSRLDFALSASRTAADQGLNSISEEVRSVGFGGFALQDYDDHLSVGVFKIRRSTIDPTKLTVSRTEKFVGSFDSRRKVANPIGGAPIPAFLQDIINNGSSTVKCFMHPSVAVTFTWTGGSSPIPTSRVRVASDAKRMYAVGVYTSESANVDAQKAIGEVPLKLQRVLASIDNTENTIVDVVVDAGLSTIYSVSEWQASAAGSDNINFNDETIVPVDDSTSPNGGGAKAKEDWQVVANVLINFAQNTRKDCVAIIDPHRSCFITGSISKNIDDLDKNFTEDIYSPLKKMVDELETNYACVYANWVKLNDIYTGRRFWAPFSGYAAAVFARNDQVAAPWFAPAGLNRGLVGNVLDIAFNPNLKQRDRLYEAATNPVVFFNGDGYAVFGQKTLQNKPSAFDRINVRRLFLVLERAVARTIKYFVFEPNTKFTRKQVVDTISPVFEQVKNQQGLYDYLIVCDERNNTPDSIDRNELIVDIYLKPVRAAEFILVNFIATRTSQSFQELI